MNPKHMTISEVSEATSIPPSTIRSYLAKNLLPEPIRTGKTVAYYTEAHLERLHYIKMLRQSKKLPLSKIKEMVNIRFPHISAIDSSKGIYNLRRQMIIDAALKVFKENGYSDTTVDMIVNQAHIGKNTFYQYYQNKEVLFIECADRLCREMVNEMEKQVAGEAVFAERFKKRISSFLAYYPKWINMMNILRGASVSNHPLFADKLNEVMETMAEALIKEVNEMKANDKGSPFRNLDSTIIGYALMGIAEYCAYLYFNNQKISSMLNVNDMLDQAWELFIHPASDYKDPLKNRSALDSPTIVTR